MTACPKCRYVRQSTDTAPGWQCPQCGVAYNKVAELSQETRAQRRRTVSEASPGVWGKIAMALFIVAAVYISWARPWVSHERASHASIADANAAQPEVILYATSWCPYCAQTRDFFQTHRIKYVEYDIERDAAAENGYREVHGRGVPVVVVGDEVIHGYDPGTMTELLDPWMR
jgi:glutaredoxin